MWKHVHFLAFFFQISFAATKLGDFETKSHGVKGEVFILDQKTLEILNFYYDGDGPDAFFYVGLKGSKVESANSAGILVPYPDSDPEKALTEYNGERIMLQLPDNVSAENIGWISVWCRKFSVDFGHVVVKNTTTQMGQAMENQPPNAASSFLSTPLLLIFLSICFITLRK